MAKQTILIVDDEASIRDMVAMTLELNGFDCLEAADAITAHSLIVDQRPDLVLLDWMMPGTSGIELSRRLRRDNATKEIPIIMITAKGEERNKIEGLETGADDYVTKPFSTKELMARIRAVLRRFQNDAGGQIDCAGLQLDTQAHRISANGTPIKLGPTEYRLLQFFFFFADRVYTREQLLDMVWGGNVYIDDRTVDVHIRRLRKALTAHGYDQYIQTVRGAGYRFSSNLS